MKRLDFIALCGKYLIDVDVALENDYVVEALQEHDDKAVEYLLKTEF
jgi:hypothetical protein